MRIDIPLPSVSKQQEVIFQAATEEGIKQLKANLNAPRLPGQSELDESLYSRTHLLREHEGWEPPSLKLLELISDIFRDASRTRDRWKISQAIGAFV